MNLFAKIAKANPPGARWRRLTSGWFVPVLLVALVVMPADRLAGADDGAPNSKKVLVLYTDRRDLPSTGRVDDAHRIALAEGLGNRLDYYSEYVDLIRFEDPKYQSALHEYPPKRYTDIPL